MAVMCDSCPPCSIFSVAAQVHTSTCLTESWGSAVFFPKSKSFFFFTI